MTPRHCQRSGRFSWSRSENKEGRIVYCLFWRDATRKLYMVSGTYSPDDRRQAIAADLRRLRHNAREMRQALRIAA
ncbi:MAG TPA: hypothetical protein VFP92_13505 [Rhodanobacteraceae bacterium]|nr:hypothetical protein [Rhodanobacteraceae bacterium]